MPWLFLCCSGYLPWDLLARVFCKFDDCFFSGAVHRNNGHIFCINPKIGYPLDFASISIAGHRFLSWPYSINIGTIVKVAKLDFQERPVNHTTLPCGERRVHAPNRHEGIVRNQVHQHILFEPHQKYLLLLRRPLAYHQVT